MNASRVCFSLALLAFLIKPYADGRSSAPRQSLNLDQKLQHVRTNGARERPDPTPTEITEQEANAYFASGEVNLPSGVRSVVFHGEPGVITANTRVDFDQLRAGIRSSNPLLAVFSGIHDVGVVAHAHGRGGRGFVEVDSVSLDGVEIPRFVLELFVQKYLQPKYPGVGLESQFTMPDKIDTATVGWHKLTITQR